MEKTIGLHVYSLASLLQEVELQRLPCKENMHLLMRQNKFFQEPGVMKIWRPDIEELKNSQ